MKNGNQPRFLSLGDEKIFQLLESSKSFQGFIKSLGYTNGRVHHTRQAVIKYLTDHGIDYKKYLMKPKENGFQQRLPDDIFFSETPRSGTSLKRRFKERCGYNSCSICGIHEWLGKPLILQVDHINGNHNDNRFENLRLLCANCHSQTDTFCNKRSRIIYDQNGEQVVPSSDYTETPNKNTTVVKKITRKHIPKPRKETNPNWRKHPTEIWSERLEKIKPYISDTFGWMMRCIKETGLSKRMITNTCKFFGIDYRYKKISCLKTARRYYKRKNKPNPYATPRQLSLFPETN
jgi:hypothetical protein